MPDETTVELTPEAFRKLMDNPEFVRRMLFSMELDKLLAKHFGDRKLKTCEITALVHHTDELVKWWRSCDAR